MKLQIALACLAVFFAQAHVGAILPQNIGKSEPIAAFSFSDIKYFHRYSKDDQYEYTPDGQANLNTWTDMVTINLYRKAKDGDALAGMANAVLDNYKAAQGAVIKTASVPRTKDKPAEHLIVVSFARPTFMEVAFARFRMHDGAGSAVIYSHRVYGKKASVEMNAWLVKNGMNIEKSLMMWNAMPKLPLPK